MSKPADPTATDLLHAMREHGSECPVCHLTQRAVSGHLNKFSYESVNDPGVRTPLRKAFGFCAPHNREWLAQQDMLGTAIIYRDVFLYAQKLLAPFGVSPDEAGHASRQGSDGGLLGALRNILRRGRLVRGSEVGSGLAAALEPREACPACRHSVEVERRLVRSWAQAVEHADFIDAYVAHEAGLCLPHLRAVLQVVSSSQLALTLVQAQSNKWTRTCAELDEVIRKFDYRYTAESKGDEFRAPGRSMEQASGHLPTHLNMPG